jgi:hypothetical protein
MPYSIAFDIAHNPRGRIDQNYSSLKNTLTSNGFICHKFFEPLITQDSLESFDILVFACPDFSEISLQERSEIKNWVKEDGGGLLLISHAGGDRGRKSNLSELSEQFGVLFENNQVLDKKTNIGWENLPLISNFKKEHPILKDIDNICYRAGCSLSLTEISDGIILSNDTSEPSSTPLLSTSLLGKGKVICIGSYEMFRDDTKGGFQYPSHQTFSLNIFNWLLSEYRVKLSSEKISGSTPQKTERETIQEEELSTKKRAQKEENQGEEISSAQPTEILRSKEDIETELNALSKKLASTERILRYVEKKRKAGDLTEETYRSRSESLHIQIREIKTKIQSLEKKLHEQNKLS